MLFTNGTGTGKTFTGLGVIKRFAKQGKLNTIIIAPNDNVMQAWVRSGKLLGLDITPLESTKDAGRGIVVTTYANFGQNSEIHKRRWDLIVPDEAHYLSANQDGDLTSAGTMLRGLMYGRDWVYDLADARTIPLRAEMDAIKEELGDIFYTDPKYKALHEKYQAEVTRARNDVEATRPEERPRVLALSATPFAYQKSIEWGQGLLWDWNEGRENETTRSYNEPDGREAFFIQHFGYRMRYNKLTEPDKDVDRAVMEQEFNSWLKGEGVLSSRILDVDADYSRNFVTVEDAIGHKIDDGLEWLRKNIPPLYMLANDQFDYHSRMFLLESIKARAAVPLVKEQLAQGKKVVVFHDFNKGGGFHPFRFPEGIDSTVTWSEYENGQSTQKTAKLSDLVARFKAQRGDLWNLDFSKLAPPLMAFKAAFPDLLVVNGTETVKSRRAAVEKFNDDASGPQVILVQADAGKEGISLHDTTGQHQRVLFNLGLPIKPTQSVQQEGRIYRVGQVSDAPLVYFSTGTNFERWTFAHKVGSRAGTAENLAMGELARRLRESFTDGFQEARPFTPDMAEGKGGKEADRRVEPLSRWAKARSFYFGQQKKTSRNKAAEGIDYSATPEPLGLKMVEWANAKPAESVLEPSAGHGAIARWFPENLRRTLVEPSSELASRAALVVPGARIEQDHFENLHVGGNKFDAIVANPPFGKGGKTAYDHLAKAFQHLNDRGRLVFIVPDGPSANERWDKWYGSEAAAGAHLVAEISLPTVVFERAGTSVKAKVLVVDRYFDPKAIPGGGQQIRDYSDASDINDFFARIEHAEVKDRTEKPEASAPDANPAAAEAEQSALKLLPEDAPDVIRGPVQAMAARSQGEPTRFKNGETARKWSWSTPDRVKMPAVAVEHAKKWLQDQHAPSWRDGTAWIFKLELGDHVERSHSSRLTFRITKTGIEVTRTLYKYDDLPPADAAVPAPTSDLPGPTVPQTAAPANSVLEAVDTKHTKSGANVYVARMAVRVPDEEYRRLNQLAKAHGGYYSKFRGAGAIPGFLFTSSEQRNAFMTAAAQSGGISLDARDKFTDIVDRVLAGRPLYMGGANVLARLKRIERLLEEGKEYEARFEITRLIGAKSNSNKLAEERRDQPRVRGVEWAKERMIRAARQGDISHAQRDLALWLLERAPHLADDAALTVVSKSDRATAGSYNPYDRLITLVSGRGDATTAAHEFLHHAERMMPLDVQQGIREEWARQLVDFQTWGQSINSEIARRAVSDVLLMNAGDGEAQKRVIKMLRDGELPESFYALTNPSEFWAENGARILADRHDAKGWVAKARQWLAELVEKLKELVGLPSDAPVLRALRNIIDGDGKFQSPRMLWDDPNGTGLARSRADVYNAFDAAAVRQRVMDHLQSDKKISWWGKTIGTKYHIAQTVPEFKPVFDGVQRYLQDTSQFSIDAARYAPQLLPLLESGGEAFRDFTDILTGGAKTRRWRADQAAAGQAIFAGTLNDRVYSDAELARGHPNESRPPLSPEQIAMYHQARAAINRSLDDLAASEAARIMRTEKLQPPARAKLDPSTARATYAQAIRSLVELGMDPKEVKRIADQVDKVFERIQKLKAEGYAPLMRFGRYSIYVTDKRNPSGIGTADPEFYTFEAEADRNRFLRVLREDPEYRGAKLDHGVMPQKAYQLFEGLTPESLEMFIQATGLEADPLVQEYLKHVVATRSAMKRLIHRKGIEGYSGDLSRVLASFVTSNARLASRNYHASQLYEDSQKIRSGDVKDEASELIKYVFNPGDEAAGLRGLLFVNFLGGSFASAAVNMTQPVTMTLPYLAQFGGGARAASALLAQAKFAAGSKAGDPELQRAVDKATREGVVAPHEIHQLYAEAIRGMGGNIWWRRFLRVWGSMFSLAEAFNRKITFAAAYQMARETPGVMEKAGVSNAYDFAVKAVEDTQGIYNRGNRPTWARGAAGATIFTFKQFSIAYLEWFKRLPKQQQLLAVGVLILAAGLQGLPGADDLDDLVDTLGQWMGYATNSKAWKRKVLSDIFGETLGHGLLYGASGVNGMPFDVQARLGLGNLVPGTGLLKKSETDRGRQVAEIAGPLGGMLSNYAGAVSELASGDIGGALQKALPTAVSNAMKAVEMVQTGEYRDTKERRVIATTPADAAVKFLGFQPQDVAEASRKRGMVIQDVNLARNTEAAIADRWAHGVVDGKPDEVAQARLDLRAWNEKNPDLPIRINAGQINRRIREIKSEAAGRMIKSAPRELRDTVKERLL